MDIGLIGTSIGASIGFSIDFVSTDFVSTVLSSFVSFLSLSSALLLSGSSFFFESSFLSSGFFSGSFRVGNHCPHGHNAVTWLLCRLDGGDRAARQLPGFQPGAYDFHPGTGGIWRGLQGLPAHNQVDLEVVMFVLSPGELLSPVAEVLLLGYVQL